MIRETFIKLLRKNNVCPKEEEPLACLIGAAFQIGPEYRKCCKWAGIPYRNKKANLWWKRLRKNGIFRNGGIYGEFEEGSIGVEFCLFMAVAQGQIKRCK